MEDPSDSSQYKLAGVNLQYGDKVSFKANGAWRKYTNLNVDADDKTNYFEIVTESGSNNGNANTLKVGSYTFYVKKNVDEVWFTCTPDEGYAAENRVNFVFGPDWAYGNDIDYFLHAWDGSHSIDLKASKDSLGYYVTFTEELWTPTTVKAYRASAGAVAPDFNEGDHPGKVYNQSNEVAWSTNLNFTFIGS